MITEEEERKKVEKTLFMVIILTFSAIIVLIMFGSIAFGPPKRLENPLDDILRGRKKISKMRKEWELSREKRRSTERVGEKRRGRKIPEIIILEGPRFTPERI